MTSSRAFYPKSGTTSGTFAAGNHHHAGSDVDSGTVAYARLPTGTTSSTVATGDHTHAGSAITSGTVPFAQLPTGLTSSTVSVGNHTHPDAPLIAADRGYLYWSMPLYATNGVSAFTPAGTMHIMRLYRVPALTVTSIAVGVSTAGSGLTSGQCFAALYTAAGTLVGQTADQSAVWNATGIKVMALTGGPYPITAGDYYVGFWYNGTTGPSFIRWNNSTGNTAISNAGHAASPFATATANTGLTTTAPSPLGAQTISSPLWWVALQ